METEMSRPVSDEEDNMQLFDEDNNDEPGNPMDEAIEVPAPNEGGTESETIKPKRVIKNPQPKLDSIRLMGPRGIGILQSTFKDVKFKGKGYEKEDLRLLMKKLEHWSHRLFPKFPFDDTLKQIEKLGTKKPVQNMVKRIRLDMFQSDELNEVKDDNPENNSTINDKAPEIDVFDELLSTGPFAAKSQSEDANSTYPSSQPLPSGGLTEEQRERIAQKRLEAIERRRKRLEEQQMAKEMPISESSKNDFSSVDDVVVNFVSKEPSSEGTEDKLEDIMVQNNTEIPPLNEQSTSVSVNLTKDINDVISESKKVYSNEEEIPISESSQKDVSFPVDDAAVNFASKESSSEGKEDKLEDIRIENNTETPPLNEQNTSVSVSLTKDVISESKVYTDEEANDVEMVTEDDLLGLI